MKIVLSVTRLILIIAGFYILPRQISAQKNYDDVEAPQVKDFYQVLEKLSSGQMEGREAGTRGANIASDYIASEMKIKGLKPFGDSLFTRTLSGKYSGTRLWFQEFKALSFRNFRDSLILLENPDIKANVTKSTADAGDTAPINDTASYTVSVRNVLGIIPGNDTSYYMIIGAHYDHLGIRDGKIFSGADDNASGVAGMLAMAGKWTKCGRKPPCNLIFAAWDAEEKGVAGSEYFVKHSGSITGNILICFNLDMIAGSAPEDTTKSILSIGTLPQDSNIRHIAQTVNNSIPEPFTLDLWNVNGHYGSDYAYFSLNGIPVMTFFSGYTDYYHSPGDIIEKVDLQKMSNILKLINMCVVQVADSLITH